VAQIKPAVFGRSPSKILVSDGAHHVGLANHRQIGMTTLFKVLVPTDGGTLMTSDGIEHEGKLWLVPMWQQNTETKVRTPKLMIRFDRLPHQHVPTGLHSYALNQEVPMRKVLLDAIAKFCDILSQRHPHHGKRRWR
jgi:hypothetical protein